MRSTWCGVRSRPSRLGSSPSRPSNSSISGVISRSLPFDMPFTIALFDLSGTIIKDVPRGLADADLFQLRPLPRKRLFPISLQAAADFVPEIFGRGHGTCELGHLGIQVVMI